MIYSRLPTKLRAVRPFVLSLVAVAVLSACSGKGSAESELKSGNEALNKGDFKAATIHFKNSLQKNSADANGQLGLGIASLHTGDFASAVASLTKALELGAPPASAFAPLMEALVSQNDMEKLLEQATKFAAAVPAQKDLASVYQARALFGLKKSNDAITTLNKALEENPNSIDVKVGLLGLGLNNPASQANPEQLKATYQAIEQLAAQATQNASAQALAGQALRLQGRLKESLPFLTTAVGLKAYDHTTRGALIRTLVELSEFSKANEQINAILALGNNGPLTSYLSALTQHRQGNLAQAREYITDTLARAPGYLPGLELGAEITLATGEFQSAERHAKAALAIAPQSLAAYRILAATYLAMNSPERAMGVLAPLVQNKVNSPDILALTGEALMRTGDTKTGLRFLEAAQQASGNSPGLAVTAANAKFAAGDNAAALALLQAAAQNNKQPSTDLTIARSLSAAGEFNKATEVLNRYVQSRPQDPAGPYNLGLVAVSMAQNAQATKYFEAALKLDSRHWPSVDALAQMELNAGNVAQAKARYQALATANPKDATPFIALARISAKTAASDAEILEAFSKARAAQPESTFPVLEQARYLNATGQAKSAIELLEPLKQKYGTDAEFLNTLAASYEANSEPIKAITILESVLGLDPLSTATHFKIGNLRLAANDANGALNNYKRAQDLQPNAVEPRVAIASALFSSGRKAEAYAAADAIEKVEQYRVVGLLLSGEFLSAEGKTSASFDKVKQAYGLSPNATTVNKLYRVAFANNQPDVARQVLRDWIAKNPKDIPTLISASDVLIEQKQYKEAVAVLNEVIKLNKNNSAALNNAAIALQGLGQPQALAMAQNAYAIEPHNFSIQDTYGWLLVESGKLEQGLGLLRSASAKAPRNAEVRLHLAKALAKSGDQAGANEEAKRVLTLTSDSALKAQAQQIIR
jgi:putative PEP-CTERM system TPR-repeat lipoprotein